MIYFQGSECNLGYAPKRIVSLVPSQTELLYYLGIDPIAQTIFCIHPNEKFKKAVKIGGTKKLNIKKILALKPDLVIGNKEENERAQIEELAEHVPVWLSDIYTIDDALVMINEVGKLVEKSLEASALVVEIKLTVSLFDTEKDKKTCLYLIWREPYMAAGRNTYINSILETVGYANLLPPDSRYPEITNEILKELKPEVVLLSSEPYPFKKKHIDELQELIPESSIKLVDGELFSWYGSRLLKLRELLQS